MTTRITQSINEENAEKVIDRYIKAGRKVDEYLAWIIFNKYYDGKEYEVNYVSTVCDMYAASLWNAGAIY